MTDYTPDGLHTDPISPEESAAMLRAVLSLLERWGVTEEQAAVLLDVPVRSYRLWKEEEGQGRMSHDRLARLSNLIRIHGALRSVLSEPQRAHAWIRANNDTFGGASALDVMLGGKLTDLERVRCYLDAGIG